MLCTGHSSTFTPSSLLGKAERSSEKHKQVYTNFQSVCLNCMGTLNPVVNLHVLCRSIATGVYSPHFRTPTSERKPKDCHFPCGVPSVKTNITLENNQKMASFNSYVKLPEVIAHGTRQLPPTVQALALQPVIQGDLRSPGRKTGQKDIQNVRIQGIWRDSLFIHTHTYIYIYIHIGLCIYIYILGHLL